MNCCGTCTFYEHRLGIDLGTPRKYTGLCHYGVKLPLAFVLLYQVGDRVSGTAGCATHMDNKDCAVWKVRI